MNSAVVDIAKTSADQTSGNKWMIYSGWCDILFLIPGFILLLGQEAFGVDLRTFGNFSYQLFRYLFSVIALNASAHLVAMAVDRAVNISFPTWHFRKSWSEINWKISGCVTLVNCVVTLPSGFLGEVKEGVRCGGSRSSLMKVYQIAAGFVFFAGSHFIALVASNAMFIVKLRNRRRTKSTKQDKRNTTAGKQSNNLPNRPPVHDFALGNDLKRKETSEEDNEVERETNSTEKEENKNEHHSYKSSAEFIYIGPNQ